VAVDGSGVRRLTSCKGSDSSPAWSPDGTKIAFRPDHDGAAGNCMIGADGSGLLGLTNGQAPSWAPDGRQVVFQAGRDANWDI
jgi:TolB protein